MLKYYFGLLQLHIDNRKTTSKHESCLRLNLQYKNTIAHVSSYNNVNKVWKVESYSI